jgi:AraC family transcriptional regulator
MKGGDSVNWVDVLNKALDYIEDNIQEEIACSTIANHVYISSAHLQRSFYCLTGLTISEYVRNRRLTLAGHELSTGNSKVIDVAMKYGYETPESFSKAFSRFHDVTPSQAKRKGISLKSYNRLTVKIIMEGGSVMDYRIEEKEEFKVVVKAKSFKEVNFNLDDNINEVPTSWDEYFFEKLYEKVAPVLGVCEEVNPDTRTFRYGIGDFEENVTIIPEGFEEWTIPANTWAVFKCVGAMPDAFEKIWKRVYSEWLPQAKYELVPSYDIEYYMEGDKGSPDYICELLIPVKEKM